MASPRSVSPPADTESEATMMTATTGRTFVELYKPSKHEASSRSFFTRKLASLFYVLGLLVCGLTVAGMGCAHGALLVTIWLDRVYRTYYRPLVNDWNERPITTLCVAPIRRITAGHAHLVICPRTMSRI